MEGPNCLPFPVGKTPLRIWKAWSVQEASGIECRLVQNAHKGGKKRFKPIRGVLFMSCLEQRLGLVSSPEVVTIALDVTNETTLYKKRKPVFEKGLDHN
eukprot:4483747-Amphidinium_carterae.1